MSRRERRLNASRYSSCARTLGSWCRTAGTSVSAPKLTHRPSTSAMTTPAEPSARAQRARCGIRRADSGAFAAATEPGLPMKRYPTRGSVSM
jgi:hypothetical protein